jgi:hypothetical protein
LKFAIPLHFDVNLSHVGSRLGDCFWFAQPIKKLCDYSRDENPEGISRRAQLASAVAILDDRDTFDDLRIEFTREEVGRAGNGQVAYLSSASARQMVDALTTALKGLG